MELIWQACTKAVLHHRGILLTQARCNNQLENISVAITKESLDLEEYFRPHLPCRRYQLVINCCGIKLQSTYSLLIQRICYLTGTNMAPF